MGEKINQIVEFSQNIVDLRGKKGTVSANKSIGQAAEILQGMKENSIEVVKKMSLPGVTNYSVARIMAGQKRSALTESQALRAAPGLRTRFGEFNGGTNRYIYPLPENGKLYNANDVCKMLVEHGGSTRKLIVHFIAMEYIPVKRSMMFRILEEYKKIGDVAWKVRGRKPKISDERFKGKIEDFQKSEARSILKKDIRKMVLDELTDEAGRNNMSTMTVPTPTDRTVNNYLRFAQAKHRNIAVRENIQTKSSARFTSETSLRATVAYLMTVAATHYMLGPVDPYTKKIEEATEGAQLMHM